MSETKECSPCKANLLIGVGSTICKRVGTEPPKCEQLVQDYTQGKKTLVEVLTGFKELVSDKEAKMIDKLIADAET